VRRPLGAVVLPFLPSLPRNSTIQTSPSSLHSPTPRSIFEAVETHPEELTMRTDLNHTFHQMVLLLSLLCFPLIFMPMAVAAEDSEPGLQITVYNNDLAVVKDKRQMEIPEGTGQVQFTDVAKRIDATSVHFECLSYPARTVVLEHNYEYDL